MASPRVSILLPTFNRGAFISDCIDTVIHQRYSDWELIILDDCSSDTTEEVCQAYARSHENIVYHPNHCRKGTPANRNTGLSLSRGELVFFIEDDILLDVNCLALLVKAYDDLNRTVRVGALIPRLISDHPQQSPTQGCQPFTFNRWTGEVDNNYSIVCDSPVETFTAHGCTLYPRALLQEIGGFSSLYSGNFFREETEPPIRIGQRGFKLYYLSAAYAYHKDYRSGSYRGLSWERTQWHTTRNHLIFVTRNFGLRAVYMVPCYLGKNLLKLVVAAFRKLGPSAS